MADDIAVDVAIVGAGIGGAGIAAGIAGKLSCVILEQEDRPGYHSTGRSAAIFLQNYGNDVIRVLTRASRPIYDNRDETIFPSPLLTPRGSIFVTDKEGIPALHRLLQQSDDLREISVDEAVSRIPILNRAWVAGAAFEADTRDIDVAALHEGWLRKARAGGATVICRAPLTRAVRADGIWTIETPVARVKARTIVNAAGAWADPVAVAQMNTVANASVLQPTVPKMANFWDPTAAFGKAILSGDVTAANAAAKTAAWNTSLNS